MSRGSDSDKNIDGRRYTLQVQRQKDNTMSDPFSFMQGLKNGEVAPTVDPEDLKRVWKFNIVVRTQMPSGPSKVALTSGGKTIGVTFDLVAQQCSPGANVGAVWLRCQFLHMCAQQGSLAAWQHGEEIDEAVFQVFATYPVHLGSFDLEALIKHLREKSRG